MSNCYSDDCPILILGFAHLSLYFSDFHKLVADHEKFVVGFFSIWITYSQIASVYIVSCSMLYSLALAWFWQLPKTPVTPRPPAFPITILLPTNPIPAIARSPTWARLMLLLFCFKYAEMLLSRSAFLLHLPLRVQL